MTSHRPFRSALVVLMLVALAAPAAAQDLPREIQTKDYTLTVEVVARGLRTPWSIEFVDRQTALIAEKPGMLRWWRDGTLGEPIRNTPAVLDVGQGGLMDVAIDPQYAENGWVYLSYTHGREGSSERRTPTMTRIVRGKIVDDAWTDEQVLFEAKPDHYRNAGVHFGCRIVFDKAGRLYFAIGDRGAQDQAQDLTRPNGKVHRINRDGSIPSDNPFVEKDGAYASIFSYGHRNPQGMVIDPRTDTLWATEHGPRGGDELNRVEIGRNYGWPVITFGINYNGTKITDLTEKEGMEQPVRQWTPSIAACGLDLYRGSLFPKWENQLLAGALAFREVRRLKIENDQVVDEEIIVKNLGRVRDVVVGPDGAIYLALNSPDVIVRLTPKP
jgi:glucose/arabinose dehydrogenase